MSNETSRMTGPARLAACLWILLAALCVTADRAEAANGDLLGVSDTLDSANRELIDMAEDSRDGTFWVLGANGSSVENHLI